MKKYPAKLFVETSTRCNLNCLMCVKQNRGSQISDGDFSPFLFSRIEPALPNLQALILNGIGEPLLNPHLESYIQAARRSMPSSGWIGFQSNGVLMTNLRALALVDAGIDKVCLSIDAITPEQFRMLREGGELESIERALTSLGAARKQCRRPDVQLGVEFVAMRNNISELPATLEWAARRGAGFAIVTHVLPYDQAHAGEAVFGNVTDQAFMLYKESRQKALLAGLDIRNYYQVRWKYSRSADEQALVDIVEEMKDEAERRGLMLDMKKLLALEQERLEETAEIFQEAKDVAEKHGLELRLPEVTLKEDRKCSFVEEGSVFIAWNGDISPCYFLWHRYDCFASGWQQSVRPKVLGNLAQQELLEIWNGQDFSSFRRDVLAYDYPSCASCGLAPCDYVQNEGFEQDCHIRSVPCGACLWCTGVFQCLR